VGASYGLETVGWDYADTGGFPGVFWGGVVVLMVVVVVVAGLGWGLF
jgi:hypothetical protein